MADSQESPEEQMQRRLAAEDAISYGKTPATADLPEGSQVPADQELCPNCKSEEWDRINRERARERDVPFNRCCRCEFEWNPET